MVAENIHEKFFYRFEGYSLDPDQLLLYDADDAIVPLSQKPLECLLILVENPFTTVTKEAFFDRVWQDAMVEDAVLAVNISNLRKVFSEKRGDVKYIQTVPRKGYKFVQKVEQIIQTIEGDGVEVQPIEGDDQSEPARSIPDHPSTDTGATTLETGPLRTGPLPIASLLPLLVLVSLLVVTFLLYEQVFRKQFRSDDTKTSVALFPLENFTGDKNLDYLRTTLPETLNRSLSQNPTIVARPTEEIRKYVGSSFDPIKEGRKMNVEYVVTGSFHSRNDLITVILQVSNISKSTPTIQQHSFEVGSDKLNELPNLISQYLLLQIEHPKRQLE